MKKRNIAIIFLVVPTALFLFSSGLYLTTLFLMGVGAQRLVDVGFIEGLTAAQFEANILAMNGFVRAWIGYITAAGIAGLVLGLWLIKSASTKETVLRIGKFLKIGWKLTIQNFGLLLKILLFMLVVRLLLEFSTGFSSGNAFADGFLGIANVLVDFYLELGLIAITLLIVRKKKPKFNDFFLGMRVYVRFALASMLYGVIVGLGFVALIIPGLYFSYKYLLFPFFILEKKMGIFESFSASAKATHGAKMDMFLLSYVLQLIIFASLIPLGLGMFIAVPLASLVWAGVYTQLAKA